jgi:glycosyltransferase involved in cell wall biosynthesis
MKVLVVASHNSGHFVPFIVEQTRALQYVGCEVEFFGLKGKGVKGYLRNLSALKKKIMEFCPDVIHAHYGLSGLFANLQRKVPVVTTYHGSDINDSNVLPLSKMAIRLSAWNVFVSQKTMEKVSPKQCYSLVPCGIDFTDLQLTSKLEAQKRMRLKGNTHFVLFAGAFDNQVKNAALAKASVAGLGDGTELIELKGYNRDEVTLLMCACDAFLLTSFSEGSPQVIKEAMACGCPIVSVDVGDVKERVEGVEGCFVASSFDAKELTELLGKALAFEGRTSGRERLAKDGLENMKVASELLKIYEKVVQS